MATENKELFKWHGWASPVGLGIFIISIALAVLLLFLSISVITDAGLKGTKIKYRTFKEWRPLVEQIDYKTPNK
ncbi:MAG: hypothetical protein LBQ83_04385 [Candidatus Margulisbacteria bacterium]|jgi:hypothetical protein|nr:hypothetical protein [Candidatus Margulisiibacteriota bacterium]